MSVYKCTRTNIVSKQNSSKASITILFIICANILSNIYASKKLKFLQNFVHSSSHQKTFSDQLNFYNIR